jgi:hypothetical protein
LHQPVTGYDALAVVGKGAFAGIRLQHQGTRFLELKE